MTVGDNTHALLQLTQWLSPNFPLGGFAFSHGLETLIADGAIVDATQFAEWLQENLEFGAGWNDLLFLTEAMRDNCRPDLNDLAIALSPSRERHDETARQGAAFVRTTNALCMRQLPDLLLPIAVGMRAAEVDLAPELVAALYLQAFAGTLTAVATRAIPLGQTEAQSALSEVAPLISQLAARAVRTDLEGLGGATLGADLASLRHETQDVRLYQS